MPINEPTTSNYKELLDYLDSLGTTKKSTEKVTPEIENEVEEIRQTTKKILEQSKEKRIKTESVPRGTSFDIQKFESLMRAKLLDEYKKLQSYERPYISVSEIVSCIRKCYYYRNKYSVDVRELFKFPYVGLIQEVGKTIHSYVQETYDFTEIDKTVLSETFKVKGRIDAYKDGYLYEIKTFDEDKLPSSYIQEHYDQGLIYSYIMNTEYDYQIHTVTCLYIVRNNLRRIEVFDIPVDLERAKSLLQRALVLRSCLVKNIVPEPLGATLDLCNFCEFRKFCEKDPSTTEKPFKVSFSGREQNLDKKVFLL